MKSFVDYFSRSFSRWGRDKKPVTGHRQPLRSENPNHWKVANHDTAINNITAIKFRNCTCQQECQYWKKHSYLKLHSVPIILRRFQKTFALSQKITTSKNGDLFSFFKDVCPGQNWWGSCSHRRIFAASNLRNSVLFRKPDLVHDVIPKATCSSGHWV